MNFAQGPGLTTLMLKPLALVLALLTGSPPCSMAQSSSVSAEQAGWTAIDRGDFERAMVTFRDALTRDPGEATLHLGAGWAAHRLGRTSEAREELRRALDLNARLTPAAVLLGEIAYGEGDLNAAIDSYEKALASSPKDPRIKERLERWRKESELHRGFQQDQGLRFTVLFEGPEEKVLARRVATVLERAYWRIGQALDAYPAETITVILYTDQQFHDITQSPAWAGGAFDGRIRVPARGAMLTPSELDRVVIHEFAHAAIRSIAPRGIPTWLNEGLAVVFEPGDYAWAARRARRAPSLIPLSKLESGFGRFTDAQASLAYAEGALAAGVLLERLGLSLPLLLHALAQGQRFDEALAELGISPPDFQAEWTARIK